MANKLGGGSRSRASGLRVAYHDHVERIVQPFGGKRKVVEQHTAGWFIEVRVCGVWKAIMGLKFARERDAMRGAESLTKAGFYTFSRLKDADIRTVKQIATAELQW